MKALMALKAVALVSCTTTHTLVTIDTTVDLVAIEMKPTSLPTDPTRAPPATRVWFETATGVRQVVSPGGISRSDDAVIVTARAVTLPLTAVRKVVFEDERVTHARKVARNEVADERKTILYCVVLPVVTLGVLALFASMGSAVPFD